jgi:hypothetical protein
VFAITAATALASGSLGILMASWREKTFQTVALTVLITSLYFAVVIGLFGLWGTSGFLSEAFGIPAPVWSAVLDPFESIASALIVPSNEEQVLTPLGRVEWVFVLAMLALTTVLIGLSIVTLRAWNPGGGRVMPAREAIEELERRMAAELKNLPKTESRPIWDNPVLWREVRTRAYGRKPIVVKMAYLLVFTALCLAFYFASSEGAHLGRLSIARTLVPIIITSLILVNVQAVTAITSERDGRALDLLLVTDISPKEFIFGKIWGVFYNTKEMLVLPIGLCVYLLWTGYVGWEVWFYIVAGVLILATFAVTLGLHSSLAYEQTRAAIVTSLGTIVFLFIGVLICIFLILVSGRFESQLASFLVFICAGAVGMYAALAVRNRARALALVAFLCPFLTFYAITHFLRGDPGTFRGGDPAGSFLAIATSYGFAVLAMLIPAVSEFDVATGRTVANEG